MSLARLVITAVIVEGRSKTSVALDYGITRFWVQTLVKRFQVEGRRRCCLTRGGRTTTRALSMWKWRSRSSGSARR